MEIDLSQVRTRGNFQKYVLFLANGRAMTTRSLEEYLRALCGLLQQTQADGVTFRLLGQLLHDAFLAEPLSFDENWLQYDTPPDLDEDEKEGSFSVLQQMICYQIADLHRMAQAGLLDNQFRYFGIDSPTGHRWYNFDPSSYLECAAQSLREDDAYTDASWTDLAVLLWLGQIYE